MTETSSLKKIALIQVWLGPIPKYFKYHFETIKNLDYIDFFFFTDQEVEEESDNFKKIKLSKEDLQNLISSKLNLNLNLNDLYLYKVNDLKASYFFLFQDYIKEYSHVGFYDIDTLFGDIYKFIEPFLDEFDVISHGGSRIFRRTAGPLSIFKNRPDLIKAFDCDLFYDCLNRKEVCAFEEDIFYENVLKNNFKCKIIENVCSFVEEDGFFINYDTIWKDGILKMNGKELLIFHFYHKNHVRFFQKNYTIKTFFKKTYCDDFYYVTYFSENYESLVENLLDSLRKYSNRKLIAYTINYDVSREFLEKWENDQFVFIRYDIEEGHKDEEGRDFNIMSLKPKICLESLKNSEGCKFVYLDTDVYATVNIDSVSKFFDELDNYPLYNSHIHDYILASNEKTNWQWKNSIGELLEEFNIKENPVLPRRKCNFFIYDNKSEWFFNEQVDSFMYLKKKNRLDIIHIFDEDIVNSLIWKYQLNRVLPLIDMEEFYDLDFSNLQNYSYHTTDYSPHVNLPKTVDDFLIFHGYKKQDDYEKIKNNYGNSVLNIQDLIISYENNTLFFKKNNFLNNKKIANKVDFNLYDEKFNLIFSLQNQEIYNYWTFYISDIFLKNSKINIRIVESESNRLIYKNTLQL